LVNNIPQTNCVIIMVCNACELVNMKQAWRCLKQWSNKQPDQHKNKKLMSYIANSEQVDCKL
jgi:hypothetical protein